MTTQQMLDERYGRRRGPRAAAVWAAGAAIAAAVVAAAWLALSTTDSVDAADTGFTLVDEHTASLTFQVSAPAGSALACALEAQDEQHGIVGWLIVEYPASGQHLRSFEETIPTVAGAATAFVNTCWVT